jgi:hypothetical protein
VVTAPLRWRSQLCPCGSCPDGTRVEWRYSLDIRFRPRAHARNVRKALSAGQTEEKEVKDDEVED